MLYYGFPFPCLVVLFVYLCIFLNYVVVFVLFVVFICLFGDLGGCSDVPVS